MTKPQITLYGIPNCDTVKKARAWLNEHGLPHTFHDFNRQGVPTPQLISWLADKGQQKLINRQGTTWRKLDTATQALVNTQEGTVGLLTSQPSVIKRPVVEWREGDNLQVSIGFAPDSWEVLKNTFSSQ